MAKKILVIDDDPVIVKYLVTLFSDNGYEAVSATDGAEGFEMLEKETSSFIYSAIKQGKKIYDHKAS